MAASTLVLSEMDEGAKPSDLWEDAYMRYEDYVKSKNFNEDSRYKGIAHQIRSYFLMIHNYYQSSPDYDATQEALDLANNCLDIVEEIRQKYVGNTEFFPALLNGIKEMSMEIHSQCFITFPKKESRVTKRKLISVPTAIVTKTKCKC